MKLRLLLLSSLSSLILALTSAVAAAGVPQGNYTVDHADRSDIERSIETSVRKMNALIRPLARSRLREDNVAYGRIRIVHSGDIEITFDEGKPLRMPADGAPVQWVNEHGDESAVSARLHDTQLVQTYESANGTRVNTFRWDAQSQILYLDVHTSSPRLPLPVRYTLQYRLQE